MSHWRDLGLPALQVSGFAYGTDAGLIRTGFPTARPGQSRMDRLNRKTFDATVLLTQSQVVVAEAFLASQGYEGFSIDMLSVPLASQVAGGSSFYVLDDGSRVLAGPDLIEVGIAREVGAVEVRLCAGWTVNAVGVNTYRLTLRLETAKVSLPTILGWLNWMDDEPFAALANVLPVPFQPCEWKRSNSQTYDWEGLGISDNGQTVYACVYSNNVEGHVFKSTDKGLNWTVDLDAGNIGFYDLACNGEGSVVVAVQPNQVYVKRNGTWTKSANQSGRTVRSVACSQAGSKMVAGATGSVWTSTDYGATWVNRVTFTGFVQTSVCCSSTFSRLYTVGSTGGINRCTDGVGTTWTAIDGSIGAKQWSQIRCSGDGMTVLAVHGVDEGAYLSKDGGDTWSVPPIWVGSATRSCGVSRDGQVLVVAPRVAGDYTLYYSTDAGATWHSCHNTSGYSWLWDAVAINADGKVAVAASNDSYIYYVY